MRAEKFRDTADPSGCLTAMGHRGARRGKGERTSLRSATVSFGVSLLLLATGNTAATPIKLKQSDFFELIRGTAQDTIYTFGNVRFAQGDTEVFCDSAVWIVNRTLHLWGSVRFKEGSTLLEADSIVYRLVDSVMNARGSVRYQDEQGQLIADSMVYRIKDSTLYASGDSVILISEADSIHAVCGEAYLDQAAGVLEMLGRPIVRFGYPDTTESQVVIADYIRYEYDTKSAIARGAVRITRRGMNAESACAQFDRQPDRVRLYDSARVLWEGNDISGEFISLHTSGGRPELIDIYGDGEARLVEDVAADTARAAPDTEPVDSTLGDSDSLSSDSTKSPISELETTQPTSSSILKGQQLRFTFEDGKLRRVDSYGQAYSVYAPPVGPRGIRVNNTASGDSIRLHIENDSLRKVEMFGSVQGTYVETRAPAQPAPDSAQSQDTIEYRGEYVAFDLQDSSMALSGRAVVEQGPMFLQADSISYLITRKFLKAYATPVDSSEPDDSLDLPPAGNAPLSDFHRVTLIDGSQQVDGQYLEFSLETDRGLILQSRTDYDQAFYGGSELYRENEEVYFVDEGIYTTCGLDTPHFRFWSKHMKLINGEKVVAKPVVLFIEKIPILIIPYYVFPLSKGRRSGLLNFHFGNFNQGGRFISNVGYYWAASEYWDLLGSFDFYEVGGPIVRGRARYNKRYNFNGNVSAQYAWESNFERINFTEVKSRRWFINFNHRHTFDPTFSANASGSFISDSRFFSDFSNDLKDRLNRSLRSQVNFSKRFGPTSFSGSYIRDENLDNGSKRITYPNLSFSLPTLRPFGSPKKGEPGKWYHSLTYTYRGDLRRSLDQQSFDVFTTLAADTVIDAASDTTITPTIVDTTKFKTRKITTRYSHSAAIGPTFKILKYFTISGRLSYRETWFDIGNTDQSQALGINSSKLLRSYNYSSSLSASTNLYGTVSPKIFGLNGLRHTIAPRISYSYVPEITRDNDFEVAAGFAGVSSGQGKAQSIGLSLRNQFDAKIGSGENERRITLFTVTSSASYNAEAVVNPWSDLRTNIQSTLAGVILMNGSLVHSLNDNQGLKSFSISSSFRAAGNFGDFGSQSILGPGRRINGSGSEPDPNLEAKRTWSFKISHFYTESNGAKSNSMNLSLAMQLTPGTSINFTQRYDIARKRTINRYIQVQRKLHCWEGSFEWTPSGSNQGFRFRVNVIALPDIKYENSLNAVRGRIIGALQ